VATLTEKIASELREQITAGAIRPGGKLPTEPELMRQFEASRGTVRAAVKELVQAGLVIPVPGRYGGMVVREHVMVDCYAWRDDLPSISNSEADLFMSTARAQGREPSQVFSVRIEAMPQEIADLLEVAPDSPAVVRRCHRFINGVPHSIQDSWYAEWLCDKVPQLRSPQDVPQGTTRLLADHGYHMVAAISGKTARMPTPEEADLLGLPRTGGTPVLCEMLTAYTAERPIRVSAGVFAGDRVRLLSVHGDATVLARIRR